MKLAAQLLVTFNRRDAGAGDGGVPTWRSWSKLLDTDDDETAQSGVRAAVAAA